MIPNSDRSAKFVSVYFAITALPFAKVSFLMPAIIGCPNGEFLLFAITALSIDHDGSVFNICQYTVGGFVKPGTTGTGKTGITGTIGFPGIE
jgi:hypothetical protein